MRMGFVWRVGISDTILNYTHRFAFCRPFSRRCLFVHYDDHTVCCALLSHLLWPCFVRISEGCLYRCVFWHLLGTHSTNKCRHNISDFVAFHSILFPHLLFSFSSSRNVYKCVYNDSSCIKDLNFSIVWKAVNMSFTQSCVSVYWIRPSFNIKTWTLVLEHSSWIM